MARRLAVLLVTGLLAAVLAAGAAGAQAANPAKPTFVRFEPFDVQVSNYCGDGNAFIIGTWTGFIRELRLPNGDYKWEIHYQAHGSGESFLDGTKYIYNETGTANLQAESPSGSAPATVYTGETQIMVTSQGSEDNFFFRSFLHVTNMPDHPTVVVDNTKYICQG
jgi:hypothetical protein